MRAIDPYASKEASHNHSIAFAALLISVGLLFFAAMIYKASDFGYTKVYP